MSTNQQKSIQTGLMPASASNRPLDTQRLMTTGCAVSQLVGQVYESSPAAEQSQLLAHLLKPLGVLSLMAVSNGIFADLLFRSGSKMLDIRHEDVQRVCAEDVTALVDYVLQVSVESVESLVHMTRLFQLRPI